MPEKYSEKDIENELLSKTEQLLMEFGTDFAILARQKPIIIDGEYHNVDPELYPRRIPCIILADLKIGKFKSDYVGQMISLSFRFHFALLKDFLRSFPLNAPTIGLTPFAIFPRKLGKGFTRITRESYHSEMLKDFLRSFPLNAPTIGFTPFAIFPRKLGKGFTRITRESYDS